MTPALKPQTSVPLDLEVHALKTRTFWNLPIAEAEATAIELLHRLDRRHGATAALAVWIVLAIEAREWLSRGERAEALAAIERLKRE